MSDDLVTKMRAAVDQVSATTATDDDTPLRAAAEEEATEEKAEETESQEPAAEGEESEPAAEEPAEEPEAKAAEDDDVLIIRKQAERKVAKAEAKAKELQAKLEEAVAQNDKTKQQVAEDIFKKLRRKPISTFKEFGLEFQDLIDAGLREMNGSDDRVVSEIDELREELRSIKQEREELKAREEEKAQERAYAEARNEFLDKVTKKQFPTLYNLFEDDPEALWQEAQRIAERLAGEDDDIDDVEVIQMLEEKYRARLKRAGGGLGTPAAEKKSQPKTITTKAASEVRTTGKPFGQLSQDEQKEALKAAVKQALGRPN
jgi:hypothetical protein